MKDTPSGWNPRCGWRFHEHLSGYHGGPDWSGFSATAKPAMARQLIATSRRSNEKVDIKVVYRWIK
jgi:hypothetical protein